MSNPIINENQITFYHLNDLVEIPTQGTISKGLLETHQTKVILFAMDEGQEISEHKSSFPASVVVWEGEMNFSVEEKDYIMKSGDFLFMPSNAIHKLKAIKPTRFILTLMKAKS